MQEIPKLQMADSEEGIQEHINLCLPFLCSSLGILY